jgi:hypothetical protein
MGWVGGAGGFGRATRMGDDPLERITSSKKARIGFANKAPFAHQEADGSLGGADYETAKAVMGKLLEGRAGELRVLDPAVSMQDA